MANTSTELVLEYLAESVGRDSTKLRVTIDDSAQYLPLPAKYG
ncbi:MAG: hypothetical protein WD029_04990 [Microthrixaceae bacterium]